MKTLDTLDAYLDNAYFDSPRSLVFYQKDMTVTKSEFINTADMLKKTEVLSCLEQGEKLMEFIRSKTESGHSYWLYRGAT